MEETKYSKKKRGNMNSFKVSLNDIGKDGWLVEGGLEDEEDEEGEE